MITVAGKELLLAHWTGTLFTLGTTTSSAALSTVSTLLEWCQSPLQLCWLAQLKCFYGYSFVTDRTISGTRLRLLQEFTMERQSYSYLLLY
jgi:hypothetical protein